MLYEHYKYWNYGNRTVIDAAELGLSRLLLGMFALEIGKSREYVRDIFK